MWNCHINKWEQSEYQMHYNGIHCLGKELWLNGITSALDAEGPSYSPWDLQLKQAVGDSL